MLKKLFSSQLRINMASGVVVTVINAVAMMAAFPVYLYFLGYEKYGVWLVLATVLSFAQLGNLGIGQAVMKLVAEEYGRDDIEAIQQYVTTALALLCLSGSLILIAVLVFKTQIIAAFKLSDENARMALWLLPYISVLSIYVFIVQTLNATLSGLGRMDLANYTQSVGRIVAVSTASALLYSGRGIESLLIGNSIMYVFVHGVSLICIRRIANIRFLRIKNLDAQRCKRILRFSSGVFGSTIMNAMLGPFNKLMLSRYAGVSSIPVYEIAFKGSIRVRSLIEAGLRALVPEVSRIATNMKRHARERISQINHRAMKLIFLFGVPMYGGIIILLTPLLKFWLRQKFVDELPIACRIMLISSFLSLLGAPAYYTLLGLGLVRHVVISHIFLSVISTAIVLTIVIIWHNLSVEAVCWAILTATAAGTLYLTWQNQQRVLKEKIRL